MQVIDGKSLGKVFTAIPDPRCARGKRHTLSDIITISVLASICSADDYVEMQAYGVANEEWLRSFLELKHGTPSVDTFERVFALIKPEAWQQHFREWVKGAE